MKGYETQTALRAIGEAISAHEKQIKQHDTRIENLEKIVQNIQKQGYQLVTTSELLTL